MKSSMKRREAVGTLLTGGVGGLAGILANRPVQASDGSASVTDVFCSELTLSPQKTSETKAVNQLREFVPTRVRSGHVFCTLTSQDAKNPAITSVYAAPVVRDGQPGAEITIHFLGQPRSDVNLSLLHVGVSA
ncbi:hypothetical protein-signal peptide prediction [Rhodopirellula baltica SH 1]|uniref:Uncharacterized protein n=2 Tax=Rhodopirellula baltica TaxID=265606 RepID=Q7UKC4_RHOBA|nr:hypothetical protein [Rhodopirellula baltica]CAD76957.1 hypothetical protein-signal peptide prediction [Rhodopirellula baltica SH 1]